MIGYRLVVEDASTGRAQKGLALPLASHTSAPLPCTPVDPTSSNRTAPAAGAFSAARIPPSALGQSFALSSGHVDRMRVFLWSCATVMRAMKTYRLFGVARAPTIIRTTQCLHR
ncbi:hypothetical protein BN2476_250084 [Paraburkholderia piptadeniae]|uniref:Uncharacterized protein n=1 Tax=Paraburkholderia piptadeniae TaxID=1701573 RepID=A0A1N7S1G5_9BURK|nr:hypothetical protein BN2476_250084 [Paraburkholderia piptadeniae]